MADRKRPETQREMIYQLWFAIFGSNGDSIWELQRATRAEVKAVDRKLDEFLRSRAATCPTANMIASREEDRRRIIGDSAAKFWKRFAGIVSVISVLIAAGSLVVTIIVLT
jgi:hypothetical protein